jgi:hypothetical protein
MERPRLRRAASLALGAVALVAARAVRRRRGAPASSDGALDDELEEAATGEGMPERDD